MKTEKNHQFEFKIKQKFNYNAFYYFKYFTNVVRKKMAFHNMLSKNSSRCEQKMYLP